MEFLNELINAAWSILDNGLDLQAFLTWKQTALVCLTGLLGASHFYTQNFKRFTSEEGIREVLAGAGILTAAKEELTKNGATRATGPSGCSKSVEIGK